VEQFQLFNRLEHLCHIDWRPFNQSISIPNIKLVKPWARPMIIRQEAMYQQGISLMRSVHGQGERSQVAHHRLISKRN
jgi:hypothetical protein